MYIVIFKAQNRRPNNIQKPHRKVTKLKGGFSYLEYYQYDWPCSRQDPSKLRNETWVVYKIKTTLRAARKLRT